MDPDARMTEPPSPTIPQSHRSAVGLPTRCAFVMSRCAEAIPPAVAVSDAHHVACYLFEGESAGRGPDRPTGASGTPSMMPTLT